MSKQAVNANPDLPRDLCELLDCNSLQSLMDDLFDITGFSLSIIDLDNNVLVRTKWQDLCALFHGSTELCANFCTKGKSSFDKKVLPGEYKLYKCPNNLWLATTPLLIGGEHLANLYFGQFLFGEDEPDEALFQAQARQNGFDERQYMEAFARIPRYNHEEVARITSFLTRFAGLISDMNYNRHMMELNSVEREKLLDALSLRGMVLDQISDNVIITDLEGKIVYINAAVSASTGYCKEELYGEHIRSLGAEPGSDASHEEIIKQTLAQGSFEGVLINRYKDGSLHYMAHKTRLVKDDRNKPLAMSSTSRNIDDYTLRLRQAEFQSKIDTMMQSFSKNIITSSNTDYSEILDKVCVEFGQLLDVDRCTIFFLSSNNMVLNNEHEWCRDGITPHKEDLLGIPCSFCPNVMNQFQTDMTVSITDLSALAREWRSDIEVLELTEAYSLLAFPVFVQNNMRGFLAFSTERKIRVWTPREHKVLMMAANLVSNISERSAFESELIFAKEKAQESDRIKSTFLAIVNHELRTPLNHIMGYTQLLQGNPDEQDRTAYVANIYQSGLKLQRIIKSIFDLSVSESSQIIPQPKMFDLHDHFEDNLRELRSLLRTSGKNHDIHLKFTLDQSLERVQAYADESKINVILHNLFSNAIKFTESGSIEFGCESISSEMLRYWVKDTGMGIAQDLGNEVFGNFYQVEDSSVRKHEGIGIGLAICQKLTEILGGRLYLESNPGSGSTFYFELPLHMKNLQVMKNTGRNGSDLNLENYHVLVVDDDKSIVFLFRHYLERTGAFIHSAGDGEEALDVAENLPLGSIIILDLQMPVLDGYATMDRIKQSRPDLKLIALSGLIEESDYPSIRRSGFDEVLSKPVKKETLFQVIGNLLQGSSL
jgi:PAS domain S-box-containing protein